MQQLTCKMVWSFSFYSLKKALILREVLVENSEKALDGGSPGHRPAENVYVYWFFSCLILCLQLEASCLRWSFFTYS